MLNAFPIIRHQAIDGNESLHFSVDPVNDLKMIWISLADCHFYKCKLWTRFQVRTPSQISDFFCLPNMVDA